MGVDNLLAFVKNATHQSSLGRLDLDGTTVAVDISHWIYRASYACPDALYDRNKIHKAYAIIVNYINNYVEILKFHKAKLIFVFDGMKLPAKKVTHEERAARKAEAKQLVEKYLKRNDLGEARRQMLKCLDIKFDVIQQVIEYCKKQDIDYIIAPYEADAQLAFLVRRGLAKYVVTEDTDLILYGCDKIIYKLDTTGHCVLYQRERLGKCFGAAGDGVDFEKFRRICIMSGCDYLKNIPGVGLQSAKKFFLLTKQNNLKILLPKLATYLKAPKLAGKVTELYIQGFINAESTFRHHIVYDPERERLCPLEPYPKGCSASDFPLAGKKFHRALAQDLVRGKIDLDAINQDVDLDSEPEDSSDSEDADANDDVNDSYAQAQMIPCKLAISASP